MFAERNFRSVHGTEWRRATMSTTMTRTSLIRILGTASLSVSLLFLAGCGEEPKHEEAKKEAAKKPTVPEGPIPALTAYYEVYKLARSLAPDLQTASVTGKDVEGQKSGEGKFMQWEIVFVSASKQTAYTFLYSTIEQPNILKGINNQGTQRWGGASQAATPFANSDFSIDSDAAYKAAAEKAEEWLKKNDKPITAFALGNATKFPSPMWYIQWGTKTGGYAAYINAATGKPFGK